MFRPNRLELILKRIVQGLVLKIHGKEQFALTALFKSYKSAEYLGKEKLEPNV